MSLAQRALRHHVVPTCALPNGLSVKGGLTLEKATEATYSYEWLYECALKGTLDGTGYCGSCGAEVKYVKGRNSLHFNKCKRRFDSFTDATSTLF